MDDSNGGRSFDENYDLESHSKHSVTSKRRADKDSTINKQKRNRKLAYSWDRKAESALIAAVKEQPPIWDTSCKFYKNPNVKPDIWRQVADKLNIEGVDDLEARLKWQALRSHFKGHMGKIRARKSDNPFGETHSSWPHLTAMMFIECGDVTQSSTSMIKAECSYNDTSTLNDSLGLRLENTQSSFEAVLQTAIPKRERRKDRRARVPRITPSPSCSWNSTSGRTPPLPDEISEVGNIAGGQEERYDIFGKLIALHLRRLPEDAAFNLEGRIMQMIYSTPPIV